MFRPLPYLACLLVAAGSGDPAPALGAPAATPYTIGVVYWSMNIAGQVAMRRGLEQAAAQGVGGRPVKLLAHVGGEGEAGVRTQVAAMARLRAARPDAIIVQPIDSAALARPVQEANAAGIPVVAYDQYVLEGKLACYLTSDNALAGRLDGEWLAHRFRDRTPARPLRLAIVEYPYVSSTVERVEGMRDALDQAGTRYRVVGRYEAVEPVGGASAADRMLRAHPPGTLDAVFCVNDGGGLAVARAFMRAGRKDVVFATIDGDPAAVDLIRRGGPIGIDTAQFCGPLGAESLRWTGKLLRGERVPRQVLLTVFPVTRESVRAYPGWMGPIPAVIRKPWPPFAPVPGTRIVW